MPLGIFRANSREVRGGFLFYAKCRKGNQIKKVEPEIIGDIKIIKK